MKSFNLSFFKVCIVGDGKVGKTTILHQYVDGKFVEDTQMTIGTNFFIKNLLLKEFDRNIKLQIWDLGGQEHFSIVRPNFYRGSRGIIYTFDLTRRTTFDNLIHWKQEIKNVLNDDYSKILIGNKSDLVNPEKRTIELEDIISIKEKLDINHYFETSAKENLGLENAFRRLSLDMYKSFKV